jgi:hypothetical protein
LASGNPAFYYTCKNAGRLDLARLAARSILDSVESNAISVPESELAFVKQMLAL